MNLRVKLFARARDLAGADEVGVELAEPARVADLRAALSRSFPAIEPVAANLLVAVNNEYAGDEAPLQAGSKVACFPPVSGG